MDQCSDCVFFRADTCRRAPPVRLPRRFDATATSGNRVRQEEITWGWPAVSVSDWCGSFIAKAAKAMPEGIETAPRDGSMLRLLVKFDHDNQDCNPLEDSAEPSWTIGFNTLKDTGEDHWHIAGWSWEQDCFCETLGEPIAWMPWPTPAAPQPLSTGEVK